MCPGCWPSSTPGTGSRSRCWSKTPPRGTHPAHNDQQPGLRRAGSGPVGGPFEGIEDEVEPDLELAAVVVAGLHDMLGGHLGEVWVCPGEHLPGDLLCDLRCLFPGVERQAGLLQREPVD